MYVKNPLPAKMSATVLHVTAVHADPERVRNVIFLLLPGMGGNGYTFPKSFVHGLLTNHPSASAVVTVTYPTPVAPTIQDTSAQVWGALGAAPHGVLPHPDTFAFVIIGYSMGGFIGQCMLHAAHQPYAVAGLVNVCSAFPCPERIPIPFGQLLAAAKPMSTSASAASASAASAALETMFPARWLRSAPATTIAHLTDVLSKARVSSRIRARQVHAVARFLLDAPRLVAAGHMDFAVPVLCIHGDQDALLDVDIVLSMIHKGPNITARVFKGAGHGLLLQDEAGIIQCIREWMSAQDVGMSRTTGTTGVPTGVPTGVSTQPSVHLVVWSPS